MKDFLKLALISILGAITVLVGQRIFSDPTPEYDLDYFENKFKEIDKTIENSQTIIIDKMAQIEVRDEKIKTDSLIIINSDRAFRDSLRQELNPPKPRPLSNSTAR